MEKLKFFSVIGSIFLFVAVFGAEYATTNLNDRFHTQIIYDKDSSIDIRQLEIKSINVDNYTVTNTALSWKKPKRLKVQQVRNISLDRTNIKVLNSMSNDIWIAKLRPMASKKDSDNYKGLVYKGLSVASTNYADANVEKLIIDSYKLASFDIDKVKINDFSADKSILPALSLLLLDVQGKKTYYDNRINPLNFVTLSPNAITVATVGIDDLTTVKLDQPKHIDVTDRNSTKVLVVDNSKFNVYWSADTYAELEQMHKSYQYGQSYGGVSSPRMKDFEKLVRQNGNWSLYYKWLNKLLANKTLEIQQIKAQGQFKIIGEAWIYSNRWNEAVKNQFIRNLQWTKNKGYDSVLVRFDCTENLTNMLELVQTIKDNNMKVFSTYVGEDNTRPRWNPYIDPDILEPFFKSVAAKSDGYILGWRETSTHVRLLPNEFFNYLCSLAREANPNVLIYGEIYYGVTSSSAGRRALYYNIPNNITGVIVQNMGFAGYNYGYIVQRLFKNIIPNWKTYDKVFQVIGIGPYYRTKTGHNGAYVEGLTLEDEYKAKAEIENAFKMYGGKTITMIHDGVDDNYTFYIADPTDQNHWNNTTDNLLYDTTLID